MGSRGKKKTTFEKLARESRLREKRLEKKARKEARKRAAEENQGAQFDETPEVEEEEEEDSADVVVRP